MDHDRREPVHHEEDRDRAGSFQNVSADFLHENA